MLGCEQRVEWRVMAGNTGLLELCVRCADAALSRTALEKQVLLLKSGRCVYLVDCCFDLSDNECGVWRAESACMRAVD